MHNYLPEVAHTINVFAMIWQPKGYGLDLHRNGELVKDKFGVYGTHMFTDEALNIIHNHNTSQVLLLIADLSN